MDGQNLSEPSNWEREFNRTREAYGHNVSGRKGFNCTYMYHQVIAFNPSDCDLNGGKLGPDDCMRFAREWVERYYPYQECCWALHREHCADDGTDRYAVHCAINRSMLDGTGRRLDEGRASRQKVLHASRMRDMDERWGLTQLERGTRNSPHHARQQSRGERRAREIGLSRSPFFETDLDRVRRVVRASVREVAADENKNKMRALSETLEGQGIHMRLTRDITLKRPDVVFDYRPSCDRRSIHGEHLRSLSISGRNLGRGYSLVGIQRALGITGRLGMGLVHLAEQAMDDGRER